MIMMTKFTTCSWFLEGDTLGNSWWECGARFSKSWPDFGPKKCHFPHSFSDQISEINTNFQTWSILACSRLSDSGEGSPVSSPFIFVFALSQFIGPNYLGTWNRLGLIRQKLCHHYQIRAQTKKKFVKCISNSRISISFLFIWNWKDKFVHTCTLPVVPSNPDQNEQSVFRPKMPEKPYLLGHT